MANGPSTWIFRLAGIAPISEGRFVMVNSTIIENTI